MASPSATFSDRHIGLNAVHRQRMLRELGFDSIDDLIHQVVPHSIQMQSEIAVAQGISEEDALAELEQKAQKNRLVKSMIGQGYFGTFTPKVIQRNLLENPAWYTSYTP
jgi:glycine dehydrogenase